MSGLKTPLARTAVVLAYAAPLALVTWGLWLGISSPEARGRVLRLSHSLNRDHPVHKGMEFMLSLIHISEPTRLGMLSRMPSSA